MRLTKEVRQKLLEQNEGFQRTTYFESNNSYNTNTYMISNGQLTVRSKGDTSWSDSKYDETRICDDAQTHLFLFAILVKRADIVQPSLFLPKFSVCFLALCRKWRVFKSFC